ncbi:MAG: aminotransferase class V-fold PLP-dependent enzyme [Clostridia bacterium]|nr:aminotransferase class V-fold PLP-dependent enzyme [Clostridia bacterium]
MIYFDNAATTWPKPGRVINAVCECMQHSAANPGRGGYKMAIDAGEKVFECRQQVADLFGIDNPCNVVFTFNATHALNLVIGGILEDGDHVICTQMDHNSCLRPLYNTNKTIEVSVADANENGTIDPQKIESLIKSNTKLIVMTHVSNVCGTIEPVKEVGKIAKKHSVLFLLDASQSAGIIDINMTRDNINFLAAPGHKALYGPMGTGVLCINSKIMPKPIIFGGTGSNSQEVIQPSEMPDCLESGTLNLPGICGLSAGIDFISTLGIKNIFKHEINLTKIFLNGISDLKNYKVIGKNTTLGRCGVISVIHRDIPSVELSNRLNSSYNIATRAMYHCAYPSHVALDTQNHGTLRISFGIFNTIGQVKTLLYALEHI